MATEPRSRRLRAIALALATACAACRQLPSGPARATAIISLTLVEGESTQTATITRAAPADAVVPIQFSAVDPSDVNLSVADDSGTDHSLVPGDSLGRYQIAFSPRRGAQYRLHGTIDGLMVDAVTTVPTQFLVTAPTGDTISVRSGALNLVMLVVPYVFVSTGASAYEYRVASQSGVVQYTGRLQAAQGVMTFLRTPEPQTVQLLAYNLDAAEWLVRSTPHSNITGAFGGFGAALVLRRALVTP